MTIMGQVSTAGAGAANTVDPQIGDVMPVGHKHAGRIYAGISETTKEPFYAAAEDSGVFKWNEAMQFAAQQNARVPSDKELNQLFETKDEGALKSTFNVSGSHPAGWYCSSTDHRDRADCAWFQRFDGGYRIWLPKDDQSSLRLVWD